MTMELTILNIRTANFFFDLLRNILQQFHSSRHFNVLQIIASFFYLTCNIFKLP